MIKRNQLHFFKIVNIEEHWRQLSFFLNIKARAKRGHAQFASAEHKRVDDWRKEDRFNIDISYDDIAMNPLLPHVKTE